MRRIAIIGAGPAGLSAAYQLLKESSNYSITIFEKESEIGGLSKTIDFDGGRIDIGGHRFFTKDKEVQKLWNDVLPIGNESMLVRKRVSHILWNNKLIEYPVRLSRSTLQSLGFLEGSKVVISFLKSRLNNCSIDNLEQYYINQFGEELYSIFFKQYTYKLWGIPSNKLSADWGMQRVQKLSLFDILKPNCFETRTVLKKRSLIRQFQYPAFGSGQLWNFLYKRIIDNGAEVKIGCFVNKVAVGTDSRFLIHYVNDNNECIESFDYIISSMPLKELINSMNSPEYIKRIANSLEYRDMIIIALSIPKENMGDLFDLARSDCWIYAQDPKFTFGRVQILNNWSPYLSKIDNNILIELEVFCNQNDNVWMTDDLTLANHLMNELISCGFLKYATIPSNYLVKRIEKAYPVYAYGYNQINHIEEWINGIDNLICIGRNGQHRYNNMDHSVKTGIEAAKSIMDKQYDKKQIWKINRETKYIEK